MFHGNVLSECRVSEQNHPAPTLAPEGSTPRGKNLNNLRNKTPAIAS